MEVREIRVAFKKTVSDGAYGNETAQVDYTITVAEDEQTIASTQDLLDQAHDAVLRRLKASTSEGVRQALETREEREARWAQEREEQRIRHRYPLEQAPSDEPLAGSGEMPASEPSPPLLGDDDPF